MTKQRAPVQEEDVEAEDVRAWRWSNSTITCFPRKANICTPMRKKANRETFRSRMSSFSMSPIAHVKITDIAAGVRRGGGGRWDTEVPVPTAGASGAITCFLGVLLVAR